MTGEMMTVPAWMPLALSAMQMFLLPLCLYAMGARVDRAVTDHNDDPSAHAGLQDIKELKVAITDLRIAIERLTPRQGERRHHSD